MRPASLRARRAGPPESGLLTHCIFTRWDRRIARLFALTAALGAVCLAAPSAKAQSFARRTSATYRPAYYTTYAPSRPSYSYPPQYQYRYQYPPTYTYSSGYSSPVQAPAAVAAAPTSSGDPTGFLSWLNATRAAHGLSAVGYDANLASWAAMNNGHQSARGMGHFVMGPARRQNCAMGNAASIGSMWMSSPAHRAALLDPSIRAIGLAGNGNYWTFNAY